MAGEFVIGNMVAKLAADTSDFIKDMTGAGDAAKKFQKDADNVEQGGKKVSGAFKGMGSTLGAFLTGGALIGAGYKLVGFLSDSVREAEAAAKAQAQLEAVLRSTGGAAGMTAQEINDLAGELSKATGVEDDLIVKNAALLLTFTKVSEDVFPDAMQAALDMSAVMGQDLQSSIVQVGKALNDPVLGVTALRRVGVQLTDQQEELVKKLVASGKEYEAQAIILGELKTEFGGAAEAMNEAGTQSEGLKNSIGNLKEEIGKGLLPAVRESNIGITGMIDAMTDQMSVQTNLREAQRLGIITQAELAEQLDKIVFTQYTAADAAIWLRHTVEDYNEAQEAGIDALNSGQSALQGWTGEVKDTTDATEDLAEANKKAKKNTEDWLDALDTGIDNTIANWLERLDFMQAGGGEIQAAGEAVKNALLEARITEPEARAYWNELFVAAQNLQVELGNITADEAAKNIRDTLGVSLQDAKKLIEEVKRKGQFNITSTITVKVKYSGTLPPGTSVTPSGTTHKKKQFGGSVEAGKPYLVGEGGPEMFVPNYSGSVIPNRELLMMEAGGEGDTYTEIVINNYNEQAAALNAAILMNSRLQRISGGMG